MARICAQCRQPVDKGRDRDHVCLDDGEPDGAVAAPDDGPKGAA